MSSSRLRTLAAALAGAGLFVATTALAEPSPALDRFSLSVGAFQADPTFNASLNTPYGRLDPGDIKGSDVTMPRITADILLGDSQGLSLDYYRFKRDYGTGFANSFAIGPTSITALGNVNLDLKLEFAKVAYKWWIGSGNTVLGLGAGVAYYKASLDTNAFAGVNGATATFSQRDSDDAYAPLLKSACATPSPPTCACSPMPRACARAAAACMATSTTRRWASSGSRSRTSAWCCPTA